MKQRLSGGGFFNLFKSRRVLMIVIEVEFGAKSELKQEMEGQK